MQDAIVRQVLRATGQSLNEYVVGCAVAEAVDDLADRREFALAPEAWGQLSEVLDREAHDKPRLAALLDEPSALERQG